MPRTAKKADGRYGEVVGCRLTPAEVTAFRERLASSGLSISDFVRRAVLTGRIVVRRVAGADPALIVELNRTGVNLNQLTRTANATGRVPPDLDRLCRTIEAVVMNAVAPEADAHGPDDRA